MSHDELKTKRWPEIQEAFLDVVDLPAEDRESKLSDLRETDAELESFVRDLLRHDVGPEPEAPPLCFGPYVALRLLGAGGMGDVYLARRSDGAFEREVAVKVIRSELATHDVVERFQRERQTLAGLEHDSIVRLLDGGTTDSGHPFLVMEYVDGEPLDRFVATRSLSVADKMRLAREIAQAVGHAHGRGIVHRDLKPSNILVRPDGQPRLLDFGIARSFASVEASPSAAGGVLPIDQATLTRTGHRLFTPRYASPEQVRGEPVSAATDVFALGALLYELLAGVSPWSPDVSDFELEREIAEALPIAPSRRASGTGRLAIAGDFDTITLKCLAQDPKRRYTDASHLAEDLQRALEGRTIIARRTNTAERGWRLVKRRPWHTLAAAASLVALIAFFAIVQRDRADATRRAELIGSVPLRLKVIAELLADREFDVAEESLATLTRETSAVELRPVDHGVILLLRAKLAKGRGSWQGSLDHTAEGLKLGLDLTDDRAAMASLELAFEHGNALAALRRFDESEKLLQAAQATCVDRLGQSSEWSLQFSGLLGRVQTAMGKIDEAIETLLLAREGLVKSADQHSLALARIDLPLGRALGRVFRDEESIPYLESALASFQWHNGTRHLSTAEVRIFLGRSYDGAGRVEEAHEAVQTAAQVYRELESYKREFLALRMASELAFRLEDFSTTRQHLNRGRSLLETELTEMVDYVHENDFRLGQLELEVDAPERALEHLTAALTDWPTEASDFGATHRGLARACLARALELTGSPEEARRERTDTLAELRSAEVPEDDPLVQELLEALGQSSDD